MTSAEEGLTVVTDHGKIVRYDVPVLS